MCLTQFYSFYLPPAEWLTLLHVHTCTHAHPHAHTGESLELKWQDGPEGNLHDWTSVEAEIQMVNQWGAVGLCSPHHHLIRWPPMSLRFLLCLAAPCKECHQHCTGFVDHIRSDYVLPICPPFFRIDIIFYSSRPFMICKKKAPFPWIFQRENMLKSDF